jgi:hypothetical protein
MLRLLTRLGTQREARPATKARALSPVEGRETRVCRTNEITSVARIEIGCSRRHGSRRHPEAWDALR